MIENVAEDDVELKPGKNKAFGEASGVGVGFREGKLTNDVKFKVKIPFQVEAHIVNN